MRWIKISETEKISAEPMHFNMTWEEQNNALKEGERIADYPLLQKLRNEGKLPMSFWVNVPNPDNISERNGYIAWFDANSYGANLDCSRDPSYRFASLGVLVVRKSVAFLNP